jgi:RNA polymerase sigma factor (sigma-70 family)
LKQAKGVTGFFSFPPPGNEILPRTCPYNQEKKAVVCQGEPPFMNKPAVPSSHSGRRYVVAMMLGTTFSALAPAAISAAEETRGAITDISRYCTTCWRNARLEPDSWTDCTQEVFTRLLERVPTTAWDRVLQGEGEERRELMRAIDGVKKRSQRRRRWSNGLVELVADHRDLGESRVAEERELVHRAAAELLSPRQRRIVQLSFEGWSVQEIAKELKVPAERISDEKYKAVRKLKEHLCSPAKGA